MMQHAHAASQKAPLNDGKKLVRSVRTTHPCCNTIISEALQQGACVEQKNGYYNIYK